MNATPTATDPNPRLTLPLSTGEPRRFSLTDITFDGDRLWQPRYGSLIDYGRVELPRRTRIAPAFKILGDDRTLEITLEIAQPGITFRTREGSDEVVAYSVADPFGHDGHVEWPAGLVDLRLVGGSTTRCRLKWDPALALHDATTLRIACDGGRARSDKKKARAAVWGGLWLSFLEPVELIPLGGAEQPPDQGRRPPWVVSCDFVAGDPRLRYDCIRSDAYGHIPQAITPELALFYASHRPLGFAVELGHGLDGVRFMRAPRSHADQILVNPMQPRSRDEFPLDPTQCQAHGKRCALRWHRSSASRLHGESGSVFRFGLVATDESNPGVASGIINGVDPTIIEPPPCDPLTGVCLPPGG